MGKSRTIGVKIIQKRIQRSKKGIDIGGIYTKRDSKTTRVKYKVIGFVSLDEVLLHSNKPDLVSGNNYSKYQWSIKSFHKDFKRVG